MVVVEVAVELVVELAMVLDVQDPFDAVATGRRHFHVHCLHLRLESIEAVVLHVTWRVSHFHSRNDIHLQSPVVLQQLHHRVCFWLGSVDAVGDACRNDCRRWNHFRKA